MIFDFLRPTRGYAFIANIDGKTAVYYLTRKSGKDLVKELAKPLQTRSESYPIVGVQSKQVYPVNLQAVESYVLGPIKSRDEMYEFGRWYRTTGLNNLNS